MKRILMLTALIALCFSAAKAQNAITLEQVAGTVGGDIQIGTTVNFQLRINVDAGVDTKLAGTTIGFRLYSPEGASWTSTSGEYLPTWPPQSGGFDFLRQISPWGANGIGADTIAFNNATLFGAGCPPGYSQVAWQINVVIPNDPSLNNKSLCIDSCTFVGPANLNWLWNDLNNELFPNWAGEQCFTIVDPNASGGSLLVSPDTANFSIEENPTGASSTVFSVAEAGGGNIAFDQAVNQAWLSVSPLSSTTPDNIMLTVDASGLAPGSYFDSVTITSADADNSPVYKYVSLVVTAAPNFTFAPDTLFFTAEEGGANPTSQNIEISLSDASGRPVLLTPASPRVSVNPATGDTPLTSAVSVSIAGMTPNTYIDSVMVQQGELPKTATADYFFVVTEITEVVQPVVLQVSPTSLSFSAVTGDGVLPSQMLYITEQLGRNVTYTAGVTQAWLSATAAGGTTPDSVEVTADASGLAVGVYVDTVLVASPDAAADVKVAVSLNVTAAPEFALTPDTLFFSGMEGGANPDNQSFEVALSNGGSVSFTAASLSGNVSVDPTSGTTPADLSVGVDISSLTEGVYVDSIMISEGTVTDKYAQQAQDVYLVVMTTIGAIPNDLVVNPTTLSFTATEGDTSPQMGVFTAIEANGRAINFTVTSKLGAAFVTFDNAGTTPDSVNVMVDPTDLTPGVYDDTLMVVLEDNSDTGYVAVVLNIEEYVCTNLVLSDTLLMYTAFDGDTVGTPASRTVSVHGSVPHINFEYTMSVELGVDWINLVNWSVFPPDSGTSIVGGPQDTVWVSVDPSGLSVGTHTASIAVISESPNVCMPALRTLTVSVTVHEVIVPSDDTVRVVNTPAVPGMSVVVPVDLKSSCNLFAAKVDLAYDDSSLVFDSVSFDDGVFVDGTNWFTLAPGIISIQSDNEGMAILPVDANWFNLHFTVRCEAMPGVYDLMLTDLFCDGPDTCGSYFVRNCGEGAELERPEFRTGGIIVDNVDNYVCGYVVDTAGNSIEGATVQLWSLFPIGLPIDETTSSGIGSFAFSDFNTVPFSLFATADGYYPNLVEDLNFGDKGIMIVMTPLSELTPTSEWVDYFCNTNTYRGEALPVGSVVEAWANGTLVGRDIVDVAGSYGFMPVYRDDFSTGTVDGAVTGDMLTFTVNGLVAIASGNTTYPAEYAQVQVCLSAGEQVTQECELAEGWNLVSWRVQTETTDIMTVLGPYMSNIDVVLGFERGGLTYDPDLPEFSTLWNTDHLSGYWIRVKEGMGFTLAVNGTAVPVSTPIPVTTGWNLVSYLPEMMLTPENALSSLDGILLYAYGWDNGILTYQPGSQFSNLENMMSCNGYWVKVSANGDLVYPSVVPLTLAANIIPSRDVAATTSTDYSLGDVNATTQWMNLYSSDLKLDGKTVKAGTVIAAHREDGAKIGSFVMNTNGRFGFMPVYGSSSTGEAAGIKAGEQFYLTVDGKVTTERFAWTSNGDRREIGNLSAASTSGETPLPNDFALDQNYPNPFNPTTTISFTLPAAGKVKLEVYNILGKLVSTPYDGVAGSGTTSVVWDGRDLRGESVSSGVYFYRLTTDTFTDTKKMMLLK